VLLAFLAGIHTCAAAQAPAAAAPATPEHPITALPYTPSLDTAAMDRSADPCVDFYQYSCGGWIKSNPIPADQAKWDVYRKMALDNEMFLWGILQDLARPARDRTATQQLIGDYFAACMDETTVNRRGLQPLRPFLKSVADMQSRQDLPRVLAGLHLALADRGLYFALASSQDFSSSTDVIAFAYAGGLGLPDRDYYTKDDEKSKTLRAQYVAHVARMFALLGNAQKPAQRKADAVMDMETELARASLTRVERRDPYKLFHKMNAGNLQALTPGFDWRVYLSALGIAGQDSFNVTQPAFYEALAAQWRNRSLDDIKTYLTWHVIHAAAPHLSTAFVDEDFAFFSHTLRGIPSQKPRWKRCVTLVDAQLGEALGQEFVNRAFSPELKQKALRMARQIEQAMQDDVNALDWMSAATKEKASQKLHTMVNKIGYPDHWRDYSTVKIARDDFAGNVVRANRFEEHRDLNKIGKPLDRTEWYMTPPTINAYYDSQLNDINFPAGVLQPPLFDPRMDDAPNYGNTGGTIGHELTHGFDDSGRKFDAQGNLRDWWTREDAQAFETKAQCIVDQYAQYTIVDDIKINSKLTEGEDIADLGGLILAWMAWKAETASLALDPRDGLTPEQRFFVGYAQWACENNRPEDRRVRALTDPHSPAKYRVNGLMVNLPEFTQAFACKAGQPMVAEKRCRVW
jgi:endothelin-converting enzyme/putative endopeptidase